MRSSAVLAGYLLVLLTGAPAVAQTCTELCHGCAASGEAWAGDTNLRTWLSGEQAQAWVADDELRTWLSGALATEAAFQRRGRSQGSLDGVRDSVRLILSSRVRRDSTAARAGIALADIMRGEAGGYTTDVARLAATVIFQLQLPVAGAAKLLADPRTGVTGRTNAVIALEGRWYDSLAIGAARVALCFADRRTPSLGATESRPTLHAMDEEESNFVGTLFDGLAASDRRHSAQLHLAVRPDGVLGRYIQVWLPDLW